MKSPVCLPRPLLAWLLALPLATLSAQTTLHFNPGENWGDNIDTGSGNDLTASVPSGAASISGTILGDGSVIKSGAGTLSLFGPNTYSGSTVITGGTLSVANAGNLGTGDLTASGGGHLSATSLEITGPRTFTITGTGSTLTTGYLWFNRDNSADLQTFNVTNGGTATIDSTLSLADLNAASTGNLNVSGVGSTVGAGGNIYIGYTGISTGTVANGGILSTAGVLSIATTGGSTGTFNLNEGGTLAVGGAGGIAIGAGTGLFNFNGGTLDVTGSTLTSSAAMNLGGATTSTVDTNGFDTTLSGVLSGTGALTKTGTGTLTLEGANSYTGATTISGGTLFLAQGGESLADTTNVTITHGATLDLGNADETVGSVNLVNGTITATGERWLSADAFHVQSGTLGVGLDGPAALTKTTAGTVTLTRGTQYTGATLINEGVFNVSGDAASIYTLVMNIGAAADATVNITDGAWGYAYYGLTLGDTAAGTGTLNITGPPAGALPTYTFTASDEIIIGYEGAGHVTLSGGGSLVTETDMLLAAGTGGSATVTVSGTNGEGSPSAIGAFGALLIAQGDNSNAVFTVSAGGRAGFDGGVTLGAGDGSNGTLTLTGAGSLLSGTDIAGPVTVALATGTGSTAQLNILDGAEIILADSGYADALTAGPGTATVTLDGGILSTTAGGTLTSSLALVLGGNNTLNTEDGTISLSGILSGDGGLTKTGSGTLTLSAANTFSGETVMTGGTLELGHAQALQNSTLVWNGTGELLANENLATLYLGGLAGTHHLVAPADLVIGANGADTTYSGVLSGDERNLTKTGDGTLTLTGNNTYTGNTTIAGGKLSISADSNLGDDGNSPTLTLDGGTLLTTADLTLSPARTLAIGSSHGTFETAAGTTLTLDGEFSTANNLAKTGAGSLRLTSNTSGLEGVLDVREGSIRIENTGTLESAEVQLNGGTVVFGGSLSYAYFDGLGGSSNLLLENENADAVVLSVGFSGSRNTNYSGVLSGAGSLEVRDGTLRLSNENTLTGYVWAYGGELILGHTDALATQAIEIDGQLGFAGITSANLARLDGSGVVSLQNDANAPVALTVGGGNESSHFEGQISGTGSLTKTGSGDLTLSGANDFSGDTTIAGGTITLQHPGSLAGSTVTTTGSLQFGALVTDASLGNISGSQNLVLENAEGYAVALEVGHNDSSTTFSGVISGEGSLAKYGSGTLALAGANTYTGPTTILAGTLSIAADSALGSAPGSAAPDHLTLYGGTFATTADLTLHANRGVTLSTANASIATAADTTLQIDGIIAGTGGLTKTGSGTLVLAGANTYDGNTTVSGGTLAIDNDSRLGSTSAELLLNGGTLLATTNLTLHNDRTVTLGNAGGTLETVDSSTLTVASSISGNGNLRIDGEGHVTLAGANNFTGTTTVVAGTLVLGHDNALQFSTLVTSASGGSVDFGYLATVNLGGLAGDGNLSAGSTSRTLSVGENDLNTTYSGTLSDHGLMATLSLTKTGSGTLTLAGANTHSGTTTISDGTLAIAHSSALQNSVVSLGSGSLAFDAIDAATLGGLSDSGTLTLQNTAYNPVALTLDVGSGLFSTPDFSGSFTGSGSLIKSGAGTQILSGDSDHSGGIIVQAGTLQITAENSFTGATTVNGGTLVIGDADALRNSTLVTTTTGTVDISSLSSLNLGGLSGNGNLAAGPFSLSLNVGSNNTESTYSGVISGDVDLTKSGTSTLILAGANTFTGEIYVNDGSLTLDHVQAAQNALVHLGGNAPLYFKSISAATIGGLTGSGNVELVNEGYAAVDLTLNVASGTGEDDPHHSGNIFGSGSVTKTGAGTQILSGNNSYSGGTTVQAGTLVLSGANTSTGDTTVTGGTLQLTNTNALQHSTLVTSSGGGTVTLENESLFNLGGLSGSGNLSSGMSSHTLSVGANHDNTSYSGVLSDGGPMNTLSLTKVGDGTLTLASANTFSGNTTVSGGTLALAHAAAVQNSVVTLGGGTVAFATIQSTTIGGLEGSGSLTLENTDGHAVALTLKVSSLLFSDPSYSGVLSGSGSLIKSGGGTQILTGANTFTGTTSVTAGTLVLDHYQALQNSTLVTSSSGGAISFDNLTTIHLGGLAGDGNLSSGWASRTLSVGANNESTTYSGILSNGDPMNTLSLTKTGSGTLTLAGTNTFTGTTDIEQGTLAYVNRAAYFSNGSGANPIVRANGTVSFNLGDAPTYFTSADITHVFAHAFFSTGGTLALDTTHATGGAFTLSADLIDSDDGDNAVNLTKNGAGLLILAGATTYTGTTTINAGTLQFGNGGSISLTSAIVNHAGLVFDHANNVTYSGNLSGAGTFTKTGAGTLLLAAENTYTGGTHLHGGTTSIAADHGLGAASGIVGFDGGTLHSSTSFTTARATSLGAGGGTFDTATDTTLTWDGNISGTGALTKLGDGTLQLGGSNSYSGTTNVNAGTLRLGSATALSPNTTLNVATDASFDANGFQQTVTGLTGTGSINTGSAGLTIQTSSDTPTTFNGTLAGSGGFTVSGTGTLTIASTNNTYTGETTVTGGTLNVAGDISSSSLTAVSGSGILAGTGTVGVLSLANGGTLAPGASPGTLNAGNTTWDVSGNYAWEINDADDSATPGTTWDFLNITGTLTFSATTDNPFTVSLLTLTVGNDSGPLFNFSSAQNYSYTIATASGGILGFNPGAITLNLSGFANDLAGGAWSLAQSGNNLNLVFTSAIPEPSTYAMIVGLLALLLAARRRTRA